MKKRYGLLLGLVLVLVFAMLLVACGSGQTTTTAAPSSTTAAPSTETTGAPSAETTAAPSTEPTAANTPPIKIGIAISFTGDSAAPCEQIKQGFDTEVKYINASGGINGRQVKAIYVDDQSKMDTAMAAIQALIDQKVDVIIGPFPQQCQPPARQLAEQAGVFMVGFGPPTLAEVNEDQTKYTYSFSPATGVDGCADAYVRELVADGRKNVLGFGDQILMSGETV